MITFSTRNEQQLKEVLKAHFSLKDEITIAENQELNVGGFDTLAEKQIIDYFKAKTDERFSPVDGQTAPDIENTVRDYVQGVLEDNSIDAEIVDLAVTGSRSRGLESDGSDIDVAIEFTSDLKEDALFNILHEQPFEIGGIAVDINPIRKEETGTLGNYLKNSERTIAENHKRKAANVVEEQSTIHFGLLGNGITCYDVSRTVDGDYPTVAHISNEGNVKYYDDNLSADDKRLIEEQAARQKRDFTESWNKLPLETRYERLLDEAGAHLTDITNNKRDSGLSMEETLKKYEHSVIFKDEEFSAAEPNRIKDEDTFLSGANMLRSERIVVMSELSAKKTPQLTQT